MQDAAADANKQISQIQTFIAQKKDAIIINACNADTLKAVCQEAEAAKIPVFAVNRGLGDAPYASFIGCDDVQAGYNLGQVISKCLGGDDKPGKVVLIQGMLGTSPQADRLKGMKDYMTEKKVAWELIADGTDDWDPSKAITLTQNFLQRFPKGGIDVIASQDPFGATSAAQVCKDSGRSELVGKICSVDMPKEVYAMIQSGDIYGTVLQDPAEQGLKGLQTALQYLNGDTSIAKWVKTDLPLVTVENYKDFKPTW